MIVIIVFQQSNVTLRKLFLGFKSVRFKSFINDQRIGSLSEIFDCNKFTTRQIIAKNKAILTLDEDAFKRNALFCQTHFKLSEIVEFPIVMSLDYSLLNHRYFSFAELGFSSVTASYILRFPQIMNMTPEALRKENIDVKITESIENIRSLISDFDINNSEIDAILKKMFQEKRKLSIIKSAINAEFLSVKFNCPVFKANQIVKKYSPLQTLSIIIINEMINTLYQRLHFSSLKVLQSPALLSLHSEIAESFLNNAPKILDVDTVSLVNKLPLLLKRPVDIVLRVQNILQNFDITDKQVLCCPKVLTFAPSTLQSRLEYLCNADDFSFLKPYKKFLWLVYYFNKLKPRLKVLNAHNLPHSINMFVVSESNFAKYLSYSQSRTHVQDVCQFLSKILEYSENDILLKLKEYPHFQSASLSNVVLVVRFLLNSGISKQQIFNGVGVVLYKITVVKEFYEELPNYPECQPFTDWLSHKNFMQLLIYAIEIHRIRSEASQKLEGAIEDGIEFEVPSFA